MMLGLLCNCFYWIFSIKKGIFYNESVPFGLKYFLEKIFLSFFNIKYCYKIDDFHDFNFIIPKEYILFCRFNKDLFNFCKKINCKNYSKNLGCNIFFSNCLLERKVCNTDLLLEKNIILNCPYEFELLIDKEKF